MILSKPKLFESKKSFFGFLIFCLLILFFRLISSYQDYQEFITKPFYYTNVEVLQSYEKCKGKRCYTVLKLRSQEGFSFYTTRYQREDLSYHRLRLQLFPNNEIRFIDFLGTFYVESKVKKRLPLPFSLKEALLNAIASQHHDKSLTSFYQAIFFATPLDKTLREEINKLGISHLVALSGFHLGILWAVIYGLLLLLYKPFQQRYFPFRHALFDVGLVTIILLAVYLYFVDFPPSLVRAYAMMLCGWILILLGLSMLSFSFLWAIVFMLLALFPSLLVSLSFWLSVAGVFYIYLLLHYVPKNHQWLTTLFFIPIGIFVLMLPIIHAIFPITSSYQLFSPLLSLLFVPFYPIVILLHILGLGALLDTFLVMLFNPQVIVYEMLLDIEYFLAYLTLSLLSMWHKYIFYFLCVLAFGFGGYLYLF